MLRLRRAGRLVGRSSIWFVVSEVSRLMRAEVATAASILGNGRNSVFENQLLVRSRLEQDRELVETTNPTGQFCAIQQVDQYRRFLAADSVQKGVLNILRRRLSVGHGLTPETGIKWGNTEYRSKSVLTRFY